MQDLNLRLLGPKPSAIPGYANLRITIKDKGRPRGFCTSYYTPYLYISDTLPYSSNISTFSRIPWYCYLIRTRTWTNRTKICRATITPWGSMKYWSILYISPPPYLFKIDPVGMCHMMSIYLHMIFNINHITDFVEPQRFELWTFWMQIRCSAKLSYDPLKQFQPYCELGIRICVLCS